MYVAVVVLTGRWFAVWGVGVRLGPAGLRQIVQPRFTARNIFQMTNDEALPLVRELGVANVGTALVALLSIVAPSFVFARFDIGSVVLWRCWCNSPRGAGPLPIRKHRHGERHLHHRCPGRLRRVHLPVTLGPLPTSSRTPHPGLTTPSRDDAAARGAVHLTKKPLMSPLHRPVVRTLAAFRYFDVKA